MAVVTVSRELGSAGDEIALRIAENLGYDLVDNRLIIEVARRAGVSVEKVRNYDEQYQSRAVEWLMGFINPRMGKILAGEGKHLDPASFIEYAKTVIRGLAENGKMVIVGRAGQFILAGYEDVFHLRVIAAESFRVEQMMSRHGISKSAALDMIHKSDNMRKNYIERYFSKCWDDAHMYHLTIDSSRLGIDDAVALVGEAVRRFSASHEFIPGIKDRRSGVDRRKGDRRKGDRRAADLWAHKDVERAVMKGRQVRSVSKPDRRKGDRRKGDGRRASDSPGE